MQPKLLSPFKSKDSASPVMGGSEPIAAIEARYRDEWLAIEVNRTNRQGDPVSGKLIAHSFNKEEVVQVAQASPANFLIVTYTGKTPHVLLGAGLNVRR